MRPALVALALAACTVGCAGTTSSLAPARVAASAAAPAPVKSSSPSLSQVAAAAVIVGAIGGAGVCWYTCAEPWDSAVPIGVGSALLVTLIVGVAVAAPSMAATK